MLPRITAWREAADDPYFFSIDKELLGYPIFYIGRQYDVGTHWYFTMRNRSAQSLGRRARRLREAGLSPPVSPVTKDDEERLVAGGITGGEGFELRVSTEDMAFFSLELMLGKGFASVVDDAEIWRPLSVLKETAQPIFDWDFWSPELAVRDYMRADCRDLKGLLSSESLMMFWDTEIQWHRIPPWFYVATNQHREISGFAATGLEDDTCRELLAVNEGKPILPRDGYEKPPSAWEKLARFLGLGNW